MPPDPPQSDDATAKRNALVLASAQALGGASPSIVVALGGLIGASLGPDPALATLPVSIFQLGLAAGTIPAAALMRAIGRKRAYLVGATIGAVAGSVAAAGIAISSFVVFCLGTFMAGLYSAYVQSYRFAAADTASDAFRSRAISWVMTGGILAGVIGPQTVIWARDLAPGAPFAGSFLGQAALALLSFGLILLLRPVPVPVAKTGGSGRPLRVIASQPKFQIAVLTALVSYGLMSFLMTAAPMAMVAECGHSIAVATLGLQWHILAMFGPSFFTGRLIDRYGKPAVIAAGLGLIGASAIIALAGVTVAHFWVALILLGLGWNFSFIGATTLVTECYRPEERTKAQGLNDFLVFGSVAIASFSSGQFLALGGWAFVNWLALPPLALVLAILLVSTRRRVMARDSASV